MSKDTPAWFGVILRIAGAYNVLWGAVVVLFPYWFFDLAGLEHPNYIEIWQCVGMIVGVYGVAYWIAARDATRHWPVVLAGLLGKVLGPIGMINAVAIGRLPIVAGLVCVGNDVIWWVPFGLILAFAWRVNRAKPD